VPITPSVAELFKTYFADNYHLNDVRAVRGVPLIMSGRAVIRDQDMFSSEGAMLRDPLYDLLASFGLRWFSGVSFRAGSSVWVVSLQRSSSNGMFDDEESRLLATLSQPLTDVATLSQLVGQQILDGSLDAFDLINEPVIAMTGNGVILGTNLQAARLFDDEFRVRLRRLYIRDHAASVELSQIILRYPMEGRLRLRSRQLYDFIVVRRQSKKPIPIKVLPVYGAARSPFLGARFILVLRDMETVQKPPLRMLSEIFSLSPAEARVASLLATGLSPGQVASTLLVSRETVRNQIKAVFAKTGTQCQSELVL
jgi:DNA-binding CsgD family transcriptional regulator